MKKGEGWVMSHVEHGAELIQAVSGRRSQYLRPSGFLPTLRAASQAAWIPHSHPQLPWSHAPSQPELFGLSVPRFAAPWVAETFSERIRSQAKSNSARDGDLHSDPCIP
jgi:hypothetical protein